MLSLVVGKPGSGKTVYAVDILLKISNKKLSQFEHIENIYNNISGFEFDKFKDSDIDFYKLEFNKLKLHIKLLHTLFVSNENKDDLDDILIEYCKEHRIFNTYFIIDECQNYFDSQDKSLMWWLSYHRHLHHEIMFLTQNKTLINSKYRNIPEDFIEAQPRSKAIGKNSMRYFHYTDFAMTKKNQYNTTSIIVTPKHFEMYTSGNTSKQKQVGKKYIYLFLLFISFLIVCSVLFFNHFFAPSQANKNNTNSEQTENNSNINPSNKDLEANQVASDDQSENELSNLKYMRLKCNTKLGYCLYKNQKININFYLKMKQLQDFQEISITPFMKDFVYLEVFVTDTFYSIYNKDKKNAKNNSNNSNFFSTNN